MASPFQEDPFLVHRALLNCFRQCNSPEDRRGYLCVIENLIAQKTGIPVSTPFYNLLRSSGDTITRHLSYEIQKLKMEDQVQDLVSGDTPPEEVGAMGNMIGDLGTEDAKDVKLPSSSESESGDEEDLIDLSDLIGDETFDIVDADTGAAVLEPRFDMTNIATGRFGLASPVISQQEQIPSSAVPLESSLIAKQNPISHIPPPRDPINTIPMSLPVNAAPPVDVMSSMNSVPIGFPINSTVSLPGDSAPSTRPPGSRVPNSTVSSRPPFIEPEPGLGHSSNLHSPVPASRPPGAPASRPPGAPVSRPPGAPDSRPPGAPDSRPPGAPASRPPGAPDSRPPGAPASRPPGAPVSRPPGALRDVCNSVPSIPLGLVRPKGFLPSSVHSNVSTPDVSPEPVPVKTYSSSLSNSTRRGSSDSLPKDTSQNGMLRQNSTSSERQNSTYEVRPLPRSSSSRSSSGEGVTITQPETHRGSTVYRSKRITHVQLVAFLEDNTLKEQLKEMGAFYVITACDDTKFYNISLSGDRTVTAKALERLTASLLPDTTEYVKEEIPVPVYPELKDSGYLLHLFRQLYPGTDIGVDKSNPEELIYQICGPSNQVFEVVALIRFMTSLPDKKFGMLLKLHNRLTSSPELIDRLINSAQNITKTPVMCLDCTKTEACKFLFVPGLCGTENQYKLQKHLNVLVEKFEQAETTESATPQIEIVDPLGGKTLQKYTYEELLTIRENCSEPHKALLEQKSLPIRLITKS